MEGYLIGEYAVLRRPPLFRKSNWTIEYAAWAHDLKDLDIRHTSNKCAAIRRKLIETNSGAFIPDSVEDKGRCFRCGAKVPKGILALKKLYEYGEENVS